jgi:hypothetical protein
MDKLQLFYFCYFKISAINCRYLGAGVGAEKKFLPEGCSSNKKKLFFHLKGQCHEIFYPRFFSLKH